MPLPLAPVFQAVVVTAWYQSKVRMCLLSVVTLLSRWNAHVPEVMVDEPHLQRDVVI